MCAPDKRHKSVFSRLPNFFLRCLGCRPTRIRSPRTPLVRGVGEGAVCRMLAASFEAGSGRFLTSSQVLLVSGDEIARYGFGEGHPFGPDRHEVLMRELHQAGLDGRVQRAAPRQATREELE